jgi:hypothetical protein
MARGKLLTGSSGSSIAGLAYTTTVPDMASQSYTAASVRQIKT